MKIRVLFVCLGNICRSPLAEAVLKKMVAEQGFDDQIQVDSAGTGSWHSGELPDRRARETAAIHAAPINHRARQISSRDFQDFDYIIGMDRSNIQNIRHWPGAIPEKISLMMDWSDNHKGQEVPDPYYGEMDGFEQVYKLLVEANSGLMNHLKNELLAAATSA